MTDIAEKKEELICELNAFEKAYFDFVLQQQRQLALHGAPIRYLFRLQDKVSEDENEYRNVFAIRLTEIKDSPVYGLLETKIPDDLYTRTYSTFSDFTSFCARHFEHKENVPIPNDEQMKLHIQEELANGKGRFCRIAKEYEETSEYEYHIIIGNEERLVIYSTPRIYSLNENLYFRNTFFGENVNCFYHELTTTHVFHMYEEEFS